MIHYVCILRHGNEEDAYAAFPVIFDLRGNYTCYAHIGQHSAVSLEYIKESQDATDNDLLNEIKGIYETDGDSLIVITKEKFIIGINKLRGI